MALDQGSNSGDGAQEQFVSLYRRFRPGRFGELRGQPHVVRALQGAVRDGRVAHAYLLSGPRGTGKTSSARILARALNCANPVDGEPCGVCTSCIEIARGTSLDVHELDAASNNGVDAMRDLISHAALATPGRWKVYIVDEVHMLSNAASNALLKTLEEPPSHVVFVLATTDPQKVAPTIKSRTQHFELGLLGADTLAELVHDVNAKAGLSLSEVDLSVAVRKGRGSARDTLSALDQVAASGGGAGLRTDVAGLTEALAEEDARGALVAIATLAEAGWGPQQLATELVDELRQSFLATLAPELASVQGAELDRLAADAGKLGLPRLVRAMETLGRALVDMREAPDPRVVLEVVLVRLCRPELDDSSSALLDRVARLEQGQVGSPESVRPGNQAARRPEVRPELRPATPAAGTAAVPEAPAEPVAGMPLTSRPGLGALLRQREIAADPAPAMDTPMGTIAAPAAETAPVAAPPEPAPAAEAAAPAAPVSRQLDRDALVEAWGDHLLRSLPAKVKAFYSAGRFVSLDGSVARFALPNAAHRDRCEELRRTVEAAVTDYFGTPVTLELIVDDTDEEQRPAPSRRPSSDPGASEPVVDDDPGEGFDPGVAVETGTVETMVQSLVLEAFPGAEELAE